MAQGPLTAHHENRKFLGVQRFPESPGKKLESDDSQVKQISIVHEQEVFICCLLLAVQYRGMDLLKGGPSLTPPFRKRVDESDAVARRLLGHAAEISRLATVYEALQDKAANVLRAVTPPITTATNYKWRARYCVDIACPQAYKHKIICLSRNCPYCIL